MITIFFFCILTYTFSAIPFDRLLAWFYDRTQDIQSKMDRPTKLIGLSKAPFLFGMSTGLDFLKGFLPFFIASELLYEFTFLGFAVILASLIGHHWSPFKEADNNPSFWVVVWGIYAAMSWPLGLHYPIAFVVFSLLFNAFLWGYLLTVVSATFVIWLNYTEPIFIPMNFLIFCIIFIAKREEVIQFFEHKPVTLLKAFLERHT